MSTFPFSFVAIDRILCWSSNDNFPILNEGIFTIKWRQWSNEDFTLHFSISRLSKGIVLFANFSQTIPPHNADRFSDIAWAEVLIHRWNIPPQSGPHSNRCLPLRVKKRKADFKSSVQKSVLTGWRTAHSDHDDDDVDVDDDVAVCIYNILQRRVPHLARIAEDRFLAKEDESSEGRSSLCQHLTITTSIQYWTASLINRRSLFDNDHNR